MKVFVVVALLVASVAARTVDLDTLRLLKEKSLLKDDLLVNKENLFGNQRFQLPKKSLLGDLYPRTTVDDVESEYPLTTFGQSTFGQSTYGQRRVTILSFEELISTPLFREYYNIPLFRQYLEQYPVVFQRYIESVLFQQFWTQPQFMQYFRNPVLFYKYIVPQVQVIARTYQTVSPFSGDYTKDYDFEQYLNTKNVYPEGREVVVGDYLNKIFSGQQLSGQYESFPYTRYGSLYGNKHTINNQVNYKFLLDKIYKTLFVNQPTVGDVTQVRTDVKLSPVQKEVVVDQLTGEKKIVIEEPKIVDVKVEEKVVPKTQVGTEFYHGEQRIVKEVLLKKLLLNKVITPELYQILETLPISQIEELIRGRQGIFRDVVDTPFVNRREILRDVVDTPRREILRDLVDTPLINRREILRDLVDTPYTTSTQGIYGNLETPFITRRNQHYGQQYNQLFNNEIVGEQTVPTLRELLNTVYGQQNIRDEIIPRDQILRL